MALVDVLLNSSGKVSEAKLGRALELTLYSSFLLAIVGLLFAIPLAGPWVALVPLAGLMLAAGWFAVRSEVFMVCLVVLAYASVAQYKLGFTPEEVAYGLLAFGYLGWWFLSRVLLYRDPVVRTPVDWALFIFLLWMTASVGLAILFGGDLTQFAAEWLSVSMFAYYFPVKEVVRRHPNAAPAILGSALALTVFVAFRNLLEYQAEILTAETLLHAAKGRVVENEQLLMMGGLFCVVFFLRSRRKITRVLLMGAVLMFTAGVVIGLSRALWVSYALGGLVIFAKSRREHRLLLLGLGTGAVVAALAIGTVVFRELFSVVLAGLIDRLFTLQSAVTADVSLVNRFVETNAAWEYIWRNPVLGYGFGVPMKYYSLVYELTYETSFIHNGFVGLWYRHGLVGFALMMYFYLATLWGGWKLVDSGDRIVSGVGLSVVASLTAVLLLTTVANPFTVGDKTFFFALMAGLVAGLRHRLAASDRPNPGQAHA